MASSVMVLQLNQRKTDIKSWFRFRFLLTIQLHKQTIIRIVTIMSRVKPICSQAHHAKLKQNREKKYFDTFDTPGIHTKA